MRRRFNTNQQLPAGLDALKQKPGEADRDLISFTDRQRGPSYSKMQTTEEKLPFTLTETDRKVLAMSDEEFTPHDWEDLTNIIGRVLLISFTLSLELEKAIAVSRRGPNYRD